MAYRVYVTDSLKQFGGLGGVRYIDAVNDLFAPPPTKSNEERSKEIIANIKNKLNLVEGG